LSICARRRFWASFAASLASHASHAPLAAPHTASLAALAACDPARLVPLPAPVAADAGPGSVRWRAPLLDAGPAPGCDIAWLWPLDEPPAGECRPGWVDCVGRGAPPVLPTPDDADCDGEPDEAACAPVASVVILDTSGSMTTHTAYPGVLSALCALSGRGDAVRALVSYGHGRGGRTQLVAPWGGDLCAEPTRASGAQELAARALVDAAEVLGGWPAGHTRHAVLLADEPPQDYGVTDGVPVAADWCAAHDIHVRVITRAPYAPRWSEVAARCGGDVVVLGRDTLAAVAGAPLPCAAP